MKCDEPVTKYQLRADRNNQHHFRWWSSGRIYLQDCKQERDKAYKEERGNTIRSNGKREDASAASEMMGLLERTVAHMEKMNSYNETNSESLLKMVREKDSINNKLKKDLEFLQLQRTEDHRRITGLERLLRESWNGVKTAIITIAQ